MFKQVFIPPELLETKTSTSGFYHSVCLLITSKKEMPLCNCRSTPARHAANPYQREGHPDAQEKLEHYILSIRL